MDGHKADFSRRLYQFYEVLGSRRLLSDLEVYSRRRWTPAGPATRSARGAEA